jgi:hypothetical protein
MNPVSYYADKKLYVSTISFWKRIFELKYEEEFLERLSFPKKFSSTAIVEGFNGKWEIKKESIWNRNISIYKFGYHLPFANYSGSFFGNKGQLKLPRGQYLNFKFGVIKKGCQVYNSRDTLLMEFNSSISLTSKSKVTILQKSELLDEYPWILMLTWYLILQNKKRAAHAG